MGKGNSKIDKLSHYGDVYEWKTPAPKRKIIKI